MSDMKRIYVVEVDKLGPAKNNLGDGFATVTAVALHEAARWWTVHTTDDQDDAIKVAAEEGRARGHNVRVRQFWLHSEPPKQRPLKDGETPRVNATLHDVVCLEHPNEKLRVYDLGVPVSCPVCRARMVPADFAAGLGEAEDL